MPFQISSPALSTKFVLPGCVKMSPIDYFDFGLQLLLLLGRFSHVRLCATPEMAAHQAPPSLGFSRQEHWSGLPFPSPMHESEKWKWSRSVVSNSQQPHALQPTRLLSPWDSPGKSTGVGAMPSSRGSSQPRDGSRVSYISCIGRWVLYY